MAFRCLYSGVHPQAGAEDGISGVQSACRRHLSARALEGVRRVAAVQTVACLCRLRSTVAHEAAGVSTLPIRALTDKLCRYCVWHNVAGAEGQPWVCQ